MYTQIVNTMAYRVNYTYIFFFSLSQMNEIEYKCLIFIGQLIENNENKNYQRLKFGYFLKYSYDNNISRRNIENVFFERSHTRRSLVFFLYREII